MTFSVGVTQFYNWAMYSFVFHYCNKAPTKINFGDRFILLTILCHKSTVEGNQDRNSKQKPGGRNQSKDHEGVLSSWLVFILLFYTATNLLRDVVIPSVLASSHQLLLIIKKCLTDLFTGQSDVVIFFS